MAVVLTGHTGTEVTTNSRSQTARCGSPSFLLRVYCSEPVLWKEFCSNDAVLTPPRCTFPSLAVSTSPSGRQKSKATEEKKTLSVQTARRWFNRLVGPGCSWCHRFTRAVNAHARSSVSPVVHGCCSKRCFSRTELTLCVFFGHCLFILFYFCTVPWMPCHSFFPQYVYWYFVMLQHPIKETYCNNTTIIHYRDTHTHTQLTCTAIGKDTNKTTYFPVLFTIWF